VTLRKTRVLIRQVPVSAARCEAGRPARKTTGSASAGTSGTRSIREAFAQPAFISGLRPSASLAADGRGIPHGIGSNSSALFGFGVFSEM
jgi:hypothetical protein